ncbi:hemolysin III family protein [soil metagenome]
MNFLDLREPVSAWTHAVGFALSFPATWLLWRRAQGSPGKQFCFLVFGLGLAACYAGSTLYHGVQGDQERIAWFARLDFVGIYLLIASTYTPMAGVLLRGPWRWSTLAAVWGVAVLASSLIVAGVEFPGWLSTSLYLAMGWGFLACYVEMARIVSRRALRPVFLGGVSYSVGAVLNLLGWPAFWPGVFGAHELFHLFVMLGSAAHYWFMLQVIAPFEPVDRARASGPPQRRGVKNGHTVGPGVH